MSKHTVHPKVPVTGCWQTQADVTVPQTQSHTPCFPTPGVACAGPVRHTGCPEGLGFHAGRALYGSATVFQQPAPWTVDTGCTPICVSEGAAEHMGPCSGVRTQCDKGQPQTCWRLGYTDGFCDSLSGSLLWSTTERSIATEPPPAGRAHWS